jgi:hypothetical protein
MDLKKEGEKLGAEVYERLRNYDISYEDLRLLVDHLYAGIFQKIFEETYYKKRGTEYWKGDT